MAIDTDYNHEAILLEAHPAIQLTEHAFTFLFTTELLIRFAAFKYKRNTLRDFWFVFDATLVGLMVTDTWIMTIIFAINDSSASGGLGNASILRLVRMLRLSRMARMAKLLRAMPELVVLCKGMSIAARSVFYALALLFIIIYVFAIAFTQMSKGTGLGKDMFDTVPQSMVTLLLAGMAPDLTDLIQVELAGEHFVFAFIFFIYILIATFTVLNMLIGVLVNVVGAVTLLEKEQMDVNFVKTYFMHLLTEADDDGDSQISQEEFEKLLVMPGAAAALESVGVDVVGLVDFIDYMFSMNDNTLSLNTFMDIVMQLRGSNRATVRDIVDLRKMLVQQFTATQADIQVLLRSIQSFMEEDTNERADETHSTMKGVSTSKAYYLGNVAVASDETCVL